MQLGAWMLLEAAARVQRSALSGAQAAVAPPVRRARTSSTTIGSTEIATIRMRISSMLARTNANWPSQNPSSVTPAAHSTPPISEYVR